VTGACLKAIRKLQKTGHLPSKPDLFKEYSGYGQFIDVRLAALECLADYVAIEGNFADISHVMELVENDPAPYVRHYAARLLVEHPPFPRARHHRNDREELVRRLWKLMK